MRIAASFAILALTACAHEAPAPAPSGQPNVTLTSGLPAPPQANLYADCLVEAGTTNAMNRERDGKTLRFTCAGPSAKRFYEALGPWSTKIGAEYIRDGFTWRFTQKLIKDSYGIDGCSFDGASNYRCVIILNTGDFIEQLDYKLPDVPRRPR
jgi:hypothetical protein